MGQSSILEEFDTARQKLKSVKNHETSVKKKNLQKTTGKTSYNTPQDLHVNKVHTCHTAIDKENYSVHGILQNDSAYETPRKKLDLWHKLNILRSQQTKTKSFSVLLGHIKGFLHP